MSLSPRQIEYREYLNTDHWKNLRAEVLKRDGKKCTRCPKRIWLQVHHRFYRSRFEDSIPDDLVTLCRWCHKAEHGLSKPVNHHQKKAKKRKEPGGVLFTGIPKSLKDVELLRSKRLIDRSTFDAMREQFGFKKPKPGLPRKTKQKHWWPGMYDGYAPGELKPHPNPSSSVYIRVA